MKNYLNTAEAAGVLGVSAYTLRRYVRSGRVQAFKTPGGHLRFDRDSLTDCLTESDDVQARPAARGTLDECPTLTAMLAN